MTASDKGVGVLLAFLSVACLSWECSGASPAPWERYRVIVERNVFLKDRAPRPREKAEEAVAPRPERDYVLIGIIGRGGERWAVLENVRTGATSLLRAGDRAARGRIVQVDMDAVRYEREGELIRVELGRDLEGSFPPAAPAGMPDVAGEVSPYSTAPTLSPTVGGAAERAILERLRRRRESEGGGRR